MEAYVKDVKETLNEIPYILKQSSLYFIRKAFFKYIYTLECLHNVIRPIHAFSAQSILD